MNVMGYPIKSYQITDQDLALSVNKAHDKIERVRDKIAYLKEQQESCLPEFSNLLKSPIEKEEQDLETLSGDRNALLNYEKVGEIGKGSFANVYRVKDPSDQRELALKLSSDKEIARKFIINEMSKLHHLNEREREEGREYVTRLFAFFDLGINGSSLLTSLYQKGDLFSLVEKKALSTKESLEFLKAMLDVLCFLKRHGVLHLDIKLENIFIKENGKYILGDFGLSRFKEDGVPDSALGSPDYVSPEFVISPEFCDFASDMWSTAVTVCNAYLRQNIFGADSLKQILLCQQKSLRKQYPKYLQDIVLRNPAKRDLFCPRSRLHEGISLDERIERKFNRNLDERADFDLLIGVLKQMFEFDHYERITPEAALELLNPTQQEIPISEVPGKESKNT